MKELTLAEFQHFSIEILLDVVLRHRVGELLPLS